MKITEVRAVPLAIPLRAGDPPSPWAAGTGKQLLVRVATDESLTGWGECFAYGAPLAVANVVDEALAPLLVGRDPGEIEGLTRQLHQALMIWGRRGLAMFAVSRGHGPAQLVKMMSASQKLPSRSWRVVF